MAMELFAGIAVTDFARSFAWYRQLIGAEPSFYPHDTEAVWEIAEHCYLYVEQVPERAGGAMLMIMAEDIDATVAAIAGRGIASARVEEYEQGMQKVVYRDPDGNEVSYGGVPRVIVPELEYDESIPPRPEEEIADVVRAKPDVADHSAHPPH